MDKRFWSILAIIAVIVMGAFWISNHNKAKAPASSNQPTQHVEGNNAKKVTLVEYGDYQCPICGSYYPVVKQAVSHFSNDIQFQFRNLPLTSLHQNAFVAARSAEAAGLQGKYWQMHDLLYQNQNDWAQTSNAQPIFEGYAQELGLNVTKFKQDYASEQVNNLINADLAAFQKTGQDQATPTFFINGKYFDNSNFATDAGPSVDKFTKVLNDAIAAQSKSDEK
jgi:protein-disulfide isomerase